MSLRPRVLVIDDDPVMLSTTNAQLQPSGLDVTLVPGGVEALELLDTPPVDLVICDVMMPEVNGYAVTRAFKAHRAWRYVPIILLTALDAPDAIIMGLEAGADEFVSKPVEGGVLRARAQSMLRVRSTYRALGGLEEPLSNKASPSSKRDEVVAAAGLTVREREVLDLLLLGRTHEDVAVVLGISERTSRFHQANLLQKLGAESRLDLLRLFV